MNKYIAIFLFFLIFPAIGVFGNYEVAAPLNDEIELKEGDAIIMNKGDYIPTECPNPSIKGEVAINGDKLFHTPSGYYYHKVTSVVMFCTVADAAEAGYTEAHRQ